MACYSSLKMKVKIGFSLLFSDFLLSFLDKVLLIECKSVFDCKIRK